MTDNWKSIARRESVLFLWMLVGGLSLLRIPKTRVPITVQPSAIWAFADEKWTTP